MNTESNRHSTSMRPPLYRRCTMVRSGVWTLALSCFFAGSAQINAQVPEITSPGDLNFVNVNTAFDPLGHKAHWKVKAPMPTARAGFAIAAANKQIYVMGGAVLNNCTTVATVEAYDPIKDIWVTDLAPIPAPLRWRP